MGTPTSKHRNTFLELPRHKRKDAVFQLKQRMKQHADLYGGKFYSQYEFDDERPDLYSQSFSVYFPGLKDDVLWSARVMTARQWFWEKIHMMVAKESLALLSEAEREQEFSIRFVPAKVGPTGKVLSYRIQPSHVVYPQFGNLTRREYRLQLEREIIENRPPLVHESFQTKTNYRYGIGVEIVIDVDVIKREEIEQAIERFRSHGERNWVSERPVPRDHLPLFDEMTAMELNRAR